MLLSANKSAGAKKFNLKLDRDWKRSLIIIENLSRQGRAECGRPSISQRVCPFQPARKKSLGAMHK